MENLWAIRRRKKLTVSDLAAKSGVSADLIRAYERGQQPIPTEHLERFAKALYVDVWDINTLSDAPPPPIPSPTARPAEAVKAPPRPSPKAAPKAPRPKPVAEAKPARASQVEHLRGLLQHLGKSEEDMTAELQKPLEALTQREASLLLARLQTEIRQRPPEKSPIKRRRPYLPESVDEFEMYYLIERQAAGDEMRFHLFDGSEVCGRVIGFGPYTITISQADNVEVTLNKLAIAYYEKTESGS